MSAWSLRARVLQSADGGEVEWHDDAIVTVEGGEIREIRAGSDPPAGSPAAASAPLDLRPGVLVPGFVDAHIHFPQTRIVGQASGPLLQWLQRSTFPEEARFADPGHAARVAETFCAALARAGTTWAMVYGPVFPDATRALFEAAAARGQRFIAGPVLMDDDCPEALKLSADRAIGALDALARDWHGKQGFEVAAIPRFALSCTAELMRAAGDLAAARGLRVTTHLSETPEECRIATARFGAPDYLAVYERANLIREGTVLAHCIHLSPGEWDRIAAAGAVVAHCPDSNDFLGSGGMDVAALRSRAIPTALGTDIAAGRTFRIPRIASSAYDNALRKGAPLTPADVLWWATRGGALALGRADAGQIRAGAAADLALFDPPPWAETADDILAALIFDHDAPPMRRTWVGGRLVWDADTMSWP